MPMVVVTVLYHEYGGGRVAALELFEGEVSVVGGGPGG